MNRRDVLAAAVAVGVPALPMSSAWAQAATVEVSGVKFDTSIQLGGGTLKLNGYGVRHRFLFEVYAAGLYLSTAASTVEAVLAANGAKRVMMVMLRKLDANDFGKILTTGIEKNASREEFVKSLPAIVRMGEATAAYKQLVPGDTMNIDWLPDSGVTLYVKGKPLMEPVKEPGLFAAMMKIWLGRSPADASLKDALLGANRPA
jgi:Chalcone isomerase-like